MRDRWEKGQIIKNIDTEKYKPSPRSGSTWTVSLNTEPTLKDVKQGKWQEQIANDALDWIIGSKLRRVYCLKKAYLKTGIVSTLSCISHLINQFQRGAHGRRLRLPTNTISILERILVHKRQILTICYEYWNCRPAPKSHRSSSVDSASIAARAPVACAPSSSHHLHDEPCRLRKRNLYR